MSESTFPQLLHFIFVSPLHGLELCCCVDGVPLSILLINDVVMVFAQEDEVGIIVSVFICDFRVWVVSWTLRIERLDMADIRDVPILVNQLNGAIWICTAVS